MFDIHAVMDKLFKAFIAHLDLATFIHYKGWCCISKEFHQLLFCFAVCMICDELFLSYLFDTCKNKAVKAYNKEIM